MTLEEAKALVAKPLKELTPAEIKKLREALNIIAGNWAVREE